MTLTWTKLHEDDGLEARHQRDLAAARRVLVKGHTYKRTDPGGVGRPDVEVERDVLRTSVMALEMRRGRFEVIQ